MTLYLFNPIGTAGDVYPHLAVAREMRRRGHEVGILTTPNYRWLVESHGIRFFQLGNSIDFADVECDDRLQHPYSAWKEGMKWAAVGMMRQAYEEIEILHRQRPLVVISPTWSLGARIARERLPIQLVNLVLNPCLLRSCHRSPILPLMPMHRLLPRVVKRFQYWIADRCVLDPVLLPELRSFRSELGLPSISRVMHRWWFSPDRILGFFNQQFVPIADDWEVPIRLVGHTLWDPDSTVAAQNVVTKFLAKHAGPIVVNLGSIGPNDEAFYHRLIGSIASLGQPCIILSSSKRFLPESLPSQFLHLNYYPLSDLLVNCPLIIHSASIGTSFRALAAGVPQIVFPRVNDQLDNASRLVRLGAAAQASVQRTRGDALRRLIADRLSDLRLRKHCQSIRHLHAESSVGTVADCLIEMGEAPQTFRPFVSAEI